MCSVVGMETILAPTKKTNPVKRLWGEKRQETMSEMGTVASSGHFWHSSAPDSSRTFYRGSGRSGRGPPKKDPAGSLAVSSLAAAAARWHGAQLEEHSKASVQDIVQPDARKQLRVCTRRKELCYSGKHDSSQHAGISCPGSLLDIYGRLDWGRFFMFFMKLAFLKIDRVKGKADASCWIHGCFFWYERYDWDRICCTHSCTVEDYGNYPPPQDKGWECWDWLSSWKLEDVLFGKEGQGAPKENPGKFLFEVAHICTYINLPFKWIGKNTAKKTKTRCCFVVFFLLFASAAYQHLFFSTMYECKL